MSVDESSASGASLKDLSAAEYSRLSTLWDESLEMTPADRESWLVALEAGEPQVAALLRALCVSQDASRERGFLETSDLVAGHLASMIEADADPGLVGRQFGPYRVLALLGHGGMGSVWLAERADGLFSRKVALKLIHPVLKSRVMSERFAREREILAGLNHPHIARLLDAGTQDGQSYLALDYVAGTPLTTYCDERRLSVRERLDLFRQVLSAVQYAHAHLVIHRDLKPANILVTEEGQVQLLDFGIAKLLSEGEAKETELTQLGGRALTPDYAAPEQIAGAPITTAADVYALGVMLYELLTGERPYKLKRDSRGALEEAILQADPVAPSRAAFKEATAAGRSTTAKKLSSTLRGDLDTIALKALKKSAAERYATANAFGEDIERYLRGDVVLAQPDSVAYRTLKFARRHWVGIAAAGVLLLTLAGGLAATSYEAKIAAAQRDAAAAQRDAAVQAQLRSLTQTAAGRLKDADIHGAMGIILEVLPHPGAAARSFTPEALNVFHEARAADAEVLAITGHADTVRFAAFSPDGRLIVTASADKTARVWEVATGRQLQLLSGHTDRVYSVAFSRDGTQIVTASNDKTARIWDVATGRQVQLLSGHTDRVFSAAFSPDGRQIVTASADGSARIWDAATGRQLLLLSGHANWVFSAAFSPGGRQLVTASFDKTARIWEAATGRQVQLLSGHTDRVFSAAFSPDGQQILTASADKTARIWDAATGRQLLLLSGHNDPVMYAAFSPDGQQIITASLDKTARIWDAATGRQLRLLSGHTDRLAFAAFSPDGTQMVTTSTDKTARIWDAATGRQLLLSGHRDPVVFVAFSPDGRQIVTASFDKTARVWDAATGRQVQLLSGHTDQVYGVAFSPNGRQIVTASADKTARIWDAATGHQLLLLSGHTDEVLSVAFSPDGKRIVTASLDKTTRIWDAATGRQLLLAGHADRVNSAAFSPDGRQIVTAANDNTARIWDATTGRQLLRLTGHTDHVETAAFSPDGRQIVTASDDKSARIWDAATGRQLLRLSGHTQQVGSAAFSPDGRQIVTAGDKTARIWDAATGRQLLLLSGHTDRVQTAEFSPDGKQIVTASEDNTARIWEARVPTLETQIEWVEAAQFDPLPVAERFQLGLPPSGDVRPWPTNRSTCDESSAAPYDPQRHASGVLLDQIVTDIAIAACDRATEASANQAQTRYQHGRALMASGGFAAARRDFEQAIADGYRAANIELAMLLSQPSSGMLDVPKAISSYEKAWKDGVSSAAFQLGTLYEHGVRTESDQSRFVLAPDNARAWLWYQKGADAAEPHALARFAERVEDAAFTDEDTAAKSQLLLEAFKYYAAASERARIEDWPDDAWRNWRYRRASLARVLARKGMMQEVADAYETVREQYGLGGQ